MNKHFNPKAEFTQGLLKDAGKRLFPSVDELAKNLAFHDPAFSKSARKKVGTQKGFSFKRSSLRNLPSKQ